MNLWWQWFIAIVVVSLITEIIRGLVDIKKPSVFSKEGMVYFIDKMGDMLIAYYLFSAIVGHRLF